MLNLGCNGGVTSDKYVMQSSLALMVGERGRETESKFLSQWARAIIHGTLDNLLTTPSNMNVGNFIR